MGMTPEQLRAKRIAAANRYADAIVECHNAMIDFNALAPSEIELRTSQAITAETK